MTAAQLSELAGKDLKARFIDLSIKQDAADLRDEIDIWNRLYVEIGMVTDELKAKAGDQRQILVPLYRHRNSQVRVNAAIATLFVAPDLAREALEWIVKWDVGSQRAQAIGTLAAIESGRLIPA